jgi:transposase
MCRRSTEHAIGWSANGPPLINQLRAILLERGIVVPRGRTKLEAELAILIDDNQGAGLSPRVAKLICEMRTQWSELDRRIEEFNKEFVAFVKPDEGARLLVFFPASA